MATAAATVAVLAPLLVLTAGTQANAAPTAVVYTSLDPGVDQPSKTDQCLAAYNVNYWAGGASFALGQLHACLGD
ncbi:hypothetical protein [Kitasatospora sp. NPDC087315]|uniref:hypothetical protein n=1 Tax=Kitasatospora sp. NPDC087315 TaxID=3364069 RepID=UPI0037F3EB8A